MFSVPDYYEFKCPVKLLSGLTALSSITFEMGLLGCETAMVVIDRASLGAGLLGPVNAAFSDSNRSIGHVFGEVGNEASLRIATRVADIFRQTRCDCFVALGSGACMDTAKAANIMVSCEDKALVDLQGRDKINDRLFPLITIPISAEVNAATTNTAAVYNEEKNKKMEFCSDSLYADVVAISPAMVSAVSPRTMATQGLDCLTRALEAYTSAKKNPVVDIFASAAMDQVRGCLLRAVRDKHDKEARMGMVNAAFFAGIASSSSGPGIIHALARAVENTSHVPFTTANSILLSKGIEYLVGDSMDNAEGIAGMMAGSVGHLEDKDAGKVPADLVGALVTGLSEVSRLPGSLSVAGVKEDDLVEIAATAIRDYYTGDLKEVDALDILKKALI
ncbi:MAG: iron-containing alcohol dehydrogenase [Thermodesulfobacteriota bacterium]|nr:iron-containing alcohol dehydrogenase [Thermodesulfobacteriota bacterium]